MLFSCSCGGRGGGSGGLQRRVTGAEAARDAVEVLAGDAPSRGLAVVLPLGLAGVRVHDPVGDHDAYGVVVLADDGDRSASRDDGVAAGRAQVADADAGVEVAPTRAAAAGVAVALGGTAAEQATGSGSQGEDADQADGSNTPAGGTTKSAHGVSPRGR